MSFRTHFEDAFRLLTLRAPRHRASFSPRTIVLIGALLVTFHVAAQWLSASEPVRFQMYGVNAEFAWVALSFATIALFAGRNAALQRDLALALAVDALLTLPYLVFALKAEDPEHSRGVLIAMLAIMSWSAVADWRVFQAAGSRRPWAKAAAYYLCGALVAAALPYWPVFPSGNFSREKANFWEAARAAAPKRDQQSAQAARDEWRKHEAHFAEVEAAQPARIEAALAALTPRDRRRQNIYVIGVAGYGDQDVFQHEIDQSMEILKNRLGLAGHMATLVNNPDASDPRPLASLQNLSAMLRGVAQRMDHDRDALILNMTSHGSTEGFALESEQLVERTLSPQMLKAMLDGAGVKYRAIIVSACHSGVFTKTFNDPGSLVITAAAAEKTSFGCASGRQWTYFGEAFFDKGLKQEGALAPAFEKAKTLVTSREHDEKLTPSEPQIFIGDEFRRRFPALVGIARTNEARLNAPRSQSARAP